MFAFQIKSKFTDKLAYPGSIQEIIRLIIDSNIGIVQMPCPELLCLGLDRGNTEGSKYPVVEENTRIRAQMKKYLMQYKIKDYP